MSSLELSPPVFTILSNFIEEKVGLHYGLLDRDLLHEKASARALDAGFNSMLDYYYFLRYDADSSNELNELTESLVVNETYFFREWASIEMLVNRFIAPACRAGKRPRVWSAACATGEEPLSLAMMLDELGLLNQVEIVASDISARVLARAKSGRFGKRALRGIPAPHLAEKYIRSGDDGHVMDPRLIAAIDWQQVNLLKPEEVGRNGSFDFIICRNVLIYFAENTVKTVLESLNKNLAEDGALLVGVSESLMRYGSVFEGEEHGGSFVYRRRKSK